MSKASEEQFDSLHKLVTTELINRIKMGEECSTADLKAAIDWLHKNNVTGVAVEGSPLANLLASLPELEPEDVEYVIR